MAVFGKLHLVVGVKAMKAVGFNGGSHQVRGEKHGHPCCEFPLASAM